ncbi:MAG TPA: YIP1 family protein [Candidatus Sulfomarinibacteraceae bacterium]|nr:YIP1 family protein [Candidatus Sulfomarinibacteraceae bacterium]
MLDRIIGVLKLDAATFEEIEHDTTATSQAAMVVLIVALISAIGGGIGAAIGDSSFISSFFGSLLATFGGWIVWSAVTYFVGTFLFKGQATLDEMLRVIGFAYAPQVLGIIPCIGTLIGAIWSLIAGFIAVRQGLDLDNTNALLTIIVGFIAYIILWAILGSVFGLGGALLGAI